MELALQMRLEQKLELSGGLTSSIFPKTERWLERGKHMVVIRMMFSDRIAKQYQSVMDMVFCETFRHWKQSCMDYYDGREERLTAQLTSDQAKLYDLFMLRMVQAAWNRPQGTEVTLKDISGNWRAFRKEYMRAWS
jgi:hypothetical protein